jgi:hypothetical protein
MATKNTPAAKSTIIPVRLNLLVHVDTTKWELPAAPAAQTDPELVVKALVGAGIPEDQAKVMAETMTAAPAKADGVQAVRTAVREHMMALVQASEQLKAAGATIVDADRQPKAAAKK